MHFFHEIVARYAKCAYFCTNNNNTTNNNTNLQITLNTNIMSVQKSNQKTKVFKTAWTILKSGVVKSFSEALSKAWTICKISFGISTSITFAKAETGEMRTAHAIQIGSFDTIKDGYVRFVELAEGKGQWKSFKVANLIID